MEVADRKKKHEKNITQIIASTEHADQESWSEMEDATMWKLRTGGRIANSEVSNLDTKTRLHTVHKPVTKIWNTHSMNSELLVESRRAH